MYVDRLWLVVGSAPIRLSTVITLVVVFGFVAWKFRAGSKGALYNALVASLFTLFLYEILFNVTGGFPPTDALPVPAIALLVLSIVLGVVQARRHFALSRLSMVLILLFVVDWVAWVLLGFPFNLQSTQPLDLGAEALNVSTKLLLPFAYATGLKVTK